MLSELTASAERVALVGLAKNTGKTEALAALLRELEARGRRVGVTSVGRDGEERDVINAEIRKPPVRLWGGSLVATTDALLRASGLPHEVLDATDIRTPLGKVVVARLRGPGTVEVAGPSASAGVRAVADAMLAHGAEQVLIDGAIDRRAASSPDVADRLVMSTGAVLSHDIEEVVLATKDAVDLVHLPSVEETTPEGRRLREIAATGSGVGVGTSGEGGSGGGGGGGGGASLIVGESLEPVALAPRFVLTSDAEQIAGLLDAHPSARWLIVAGALPDRFLRHALHAAHRRHRELVLIVADPTRVFLNKRGPAWYRAQGLDIQTLNPIRLEAITVNPVAPQSHSFPSLELRARLREALGDEVPIFDVLHPDYPGVRASASSPAA